MHMLPSDIISFQNHSLQFLNGVGIYSNQPEFEDWYDSQGNFHIYEFESGGPMTPIKIEL